MVLAGERSLMHAQVQEQRVSCEQARSRARETRSCQYRWHGVAADADADAAVVVAAAVAAVAAVAAEGGGLDCNVAIGGKTSLTLRAGSLQKK